MNIIFQIDGGIGKCVAATAVCKAIYRKYPNEKLIVVSGYPEVFISNPYVYKTLSFGNSPYFYQDYVENKDSILFLHNPYKETNYIHETKHLIQVWCEMYGIEYNNEQPELFLTQREIETYQRNFKTEKPALFLQTNGGGQTEQKYSWARDIPTQLAKEIVKEFSNDYTICHVRRDDQIQLDNTIHIKGGFREIAAALLLSKKRILMDSFLQHTCAALNLPSNVLWIANNPKVLGYDIHNNIMPNIFTRVSDLRNSFISKFNIIGDPIEFPYVSESQIFNTTSVIESIKSFH